MIVYIVVPTGTVVLGAYTRADAADVHARCATGMTAMACEVLDRVPAHVRDDLFNEWDDEEDTPIMDTTPFLRLKEEEQK